MQWYYHEGHHKPLNIEPNFSGVDFFEGRTVSVLNLGYNSQYVVHHIIIIKLLELVDILKLIVYKTDLVFTYVNLYLMVCIHKHMNFDVTKFLSSNYVLYFLISICLLNHNDDIRFRGPTSWSHQKIN